MAESSVDYSKYARWWEQKGNDIAHGVSSVLKTLDRAQPGRIQQLVVDARLYGNMPLIGMSGIPHYRLGSIQASIAERLTYNVVQSAIDTVTAKISKNKPKPYFLTSGGDDKMQLKAKKLNRLVEGVFYEQKAYDKGEGAFRDGAVFGDGLIHVFAKNKRVCFERAYVSELWIDELEGLHGDPRQLHRRRNIDRKVLETKFHGKKAEIATAFESEDRNQRSPHVADIIEVRESWHLPSGEGAKDGKHAITIDKAVLFEEDWEHDWFPFARFSWCPRLYGYWSQGAAEQLQGTQIEINKLLWTFQRSYHLVAQPKVLVEVGSKVNKNHLSNEISPIVEYQGTPPQWYVPPVMPPEAYQHLERLISRGYELVGVSMLSAASAKPAGLNSGKALREYNDIESDRFMTIGHAYERFYLDLASLAIATIKDIAEEEGEYSVRVPHNRFLESIDWKEIDLPDDAFTMQCFPISSLPQDPAGRLETVQEYAQAGYLTPRQARQLLDFPDLERVENLSNAMEEYLSKILDKMVDEGEYTAFDPQLDPQMALELVTQYYARGLYDELGEDKMELLRRFKQSVIAVQPPPPPQQPIAPANPEPTPTSPLLPNTNQAPAAA